MFILVKRGAEVWIPPTYIILHSSAQRKKFFSFLLGIKNWGRCCFYGGFYYLMDRIGAGAYFAYLSVLG